MERQVFINEMQATFNLRQPKASKPTNVYLVCRVQGKQVKLSTGVKIYPDHWNKEKQEAYISCRLSELDNRNNEIVNDKINKLKACFSEYKKYLCDNPDKITNGLNILREQIYKDTSMRREKQNISATSQMKLLIIDQDIKDSSKKAKTDIINKFSSFLEDNKIFDSWDNMNLDTLNKFQNYLIRKGSSHNTIRNNFNIIKSILRIANKRIDIPFKLSDSNIDSFEIIKDKTNKTKRKEKKVALTIEQVKQIYSYTPKGRNRDKETEIKDMFVLQCFVGQRISDMSKFINGEYKLDTKNNTVSIIQNKTGEIAIIPLFDEAKEILAKYKDGLKYPEILNDTYRSATNRILRTICNDLGFNEEIEYQEQKGNKVETYREPLYKLIHTHTARHTFITIMCRMDIPKDTIIIATGHSDTTMIDEVYEHLNEKDKANKIKKAISNKIGDSFFNDKEQKTEEAFKEENEKTIFKQSKIDYNIDVSNSAYEIDTEVLDTFDKSLLTEDEIIFLDKTCQMFQVGYSTLKIKKILIRLLSFGIIVKTANIKPIDVL